MEDIPVWGSIESGGYTSCHGGYSSMGKYRVWWIHVMSWRIFQYGGSIESGGYTSCHGGYSSMGEV